MPAASVVRPIVRSFKERFSAEAARHVRAGGHAVVWEKGGRARLVFAAPGREFLADLGYWSLIDLGKDRWTRTKAGPFRGLATALVPRDCHEIVRHRAERDSVWPGSTRKLKLDCLKCGSCCRDNSVELDEDDLARFEDGGRPDLAKAPYTKTVKGKLVLRLLKSKDCRHLASDNRCGIYALRPDACSTFPVASESCLYAREEELGIIDGLRP